MSDLLNNPHSATNEQSQILVGEMGLTETLIGRFEMAAEKLNLDSNLRTLLRVPGREFVVNLPVHMDNGEIRGRQLKKHFSRILGKTKLPDDNSKYINHIWADCCHYKTLREDFIRLLVRVGIIPEKHWSFNRYHCRR